MFTLIFTENFDETYKQVVKGNKQAEKRVKKTLHLLAQNPQHPSLKTHRATTRNYGEKWSSWTTGDIRIIWDYDTNERLVIFLLDIGKHSGTHKVYK